MSKKNASSNKKFHAVLLIIVAVTVILIACFYVYAATRFQTRFYEGTTINGVDCSGMTKEEAAEVLQEQIGTYSLTIQEKDGVTDVITADQIGMKYSDDGTLGAVYQCQEPWLWFVKAYGNNCYEVEPVYTYDEDALQQCVNNLTNMTEYTPSSDAYENQKEDGTWEVVPEVYGNQLDPDKTLEKVEEAIKTGASSVDLSDCYIEPTVTSDDEKLAADVEDKNAILAVTKANITLQFDDNTETVGSDLLTQWLVKDGKNEYKISETKVHEFVQKLYDKYNASNINRLFKTHSGKVVTLPNGDSYGWNMDVEQTYQLLNQKIQEGYQGILGPVMTRTDENGAESGAMYVEISIDEQMMWLYKNGEVIVETPVVTGGASGASFVSHTRAELYESFNSRATPSNGFWTIKSKTSPYHMKGVGYSLDVTYWMPFNEDVGIHDNYERVAFGGSIYQTGGSHGCINTPFEAVQTIYQNVDIGTVVVVYGKDTAEEIFANTTDEEIAKMGADSSEQ